MTLGIELPYTTGRMEVANLDLAIVDERTSFRLAAALLVCGWSLLAFRVTSGLYRSIRIALVRSWLLATLAVLVIGVFMPAQLRGQLIDRLATGFGLRLPDPDAFGHAILFGLLALLVRIGRPRDPLLVHLSCWLLVGAATEVPAAAQARSLARGRRLADRRDRHHAGPGARRDRSARSSAAWSGPGRPARRSRGPSSGTEPGTDRGPADAAATG